MSETIENQIRLGLRLVAEDVQPVARTRAPRGRPLRVVAFAVALAAVATAITLGIVSRGGGPAGARFLTDRFDYRPGGGFSSTAFPGLTYSVNCCSALAASSATDAWTVGSYVGWHWDGAAWRIVPLPTIRGGFELRSIAPVDDGEAWAVGDRNDPSDDRVTHALVEHWDGGRWRVVPVPSPDIANLLSVSASGPTNVWVAGLSFRRDSRGKFLASGTRPLLLHWDGTAWRKLTLPWTVDPGWGARVVTTGPTDVWVVSGEQIEHWDGAGWQLVPAPFGPRDPVWGFSATSPDDAWAVGSYLRAEHSRTLAAHWDGQSWHVAPTPNRSTDSRLEDVAAVGPDDVWAVGRSEWLNNDGNDRLPVALYEHWDGRSWQIMPGATPSILEGTPSIAATHDGTAWAIGSCYFDNVLVRWNGSAWEVAKHPRDQRWTVPRRYRRGGFPHCGVPRG